MPGEFIQRVVQYPGRYSTRFGDRRSRRRGGYSNGHGRRHARQYLSSRNQWSVQQKRFQSYASVENDPVRGSSERKIILLFWRKRHWREIGRASVRERVCQYV